MTIQAVGLTVAALDGNDWSNHTTLSTQLLQQKMEQIRGGGLAAMKSGSDTAQGLTRTWRVTSAGNHLRRIDVEVEWKDMQARLRKNAMTAYVRVDSV